MPCHSVGCATAILTQLRPQSTTQGFTAVHTMLVIRVYDEAGNVIETHEQAGDFKEA
jgi:hypothetical protein